MDLCCIIFEMNPSFLKIYVKLSALIREFIGLLVIELVTPYIYGEFASRESSKRNHYNHVV